MAVADDGEVAGSVSGGCVEGAVVTEALDILTTGDRRLVTFGYSDDEAFAVGLTCGGTDPPLHRTPGLVSPVADAIYDTWRAAVVDHRPVALVTVVEGPGTGAKLLVGQGIDTLGSLGNDDLDRVVERDAVGELAAGTSGVRHYGAHGEARESTVSVFIETFAPPPHMLDLRRRRLHRRPGAGRQGDRLPGDGVRRPRGVRHHAPVPAGRRGRRRLAPPPLEPRSATGSAPATRCACSPTTTSSTCRPSRPPSPPTWATWGRWGVGAPAPSGSSACAADGADMDAVRARLHAPIGLDLGGRTPEETAIAICAEIIAARTGRPTASLSGTTGPIH